MSVPEVPQEILDVVQCVRKGKLLPPGVTADYGAYTPKESILKRYMKRFRPSKGCGCKAREKWLNSIMPGLGTLIRWITTITGIKWIVDRWYQK